MTMVLFMSLIIIFQVTLIYFLKSKLAIMTICKKVKGYKATNCKDHESTLTVSYGTYTIK